MDVRNQLVINLNKQLNERPYEERKRIINSILFDLDNTNILCPPASTLADEIEEDFHLDLMFEQEVSNEYVENDICQVDPERESRIKAFEKFYESEGLIGDEEVPTPFVGVSKPIERFGRSPIHSAVLAGDIEAIKDYIKQGANFNVKDNNKNTPWELALLEGEIEIAKLLEPFSRKK